MCTEFRVVVRCVGVGISGTRQNGAALDSRLKPLFPECETLEFVETIFLRSTAKRKESVSMFSITA